MKKTHTHHILPKHMGGSDEPTNIKEVTVENHAEEHRLLWKKYGKREDWLAWKSLSKQIGKEELWLERSSLGGKKMKGYKKTKEHLENISKSLKGKTYEEMGVVNTTERKQKVSEAMMGNTNSKNHNKDSYKKKQSQVMKEAWKRRKAKQNI